MIGDYAEEGAVEAKSQCGHGVERCTWNAAFRAQASQLRPSTVMPFSAVGGLRV